MKRIGMIVLICCSVAVSHAQVTGKAEHLLNEVSQKVKGYENIQIDFSFTRENPQENIKHETRGDVSLEGEKYLLNILGTTRLFDGNKLYTIIPEDEEIVISTYDPKKDDNITPSKMLSFYNEGYTYKWDIIQNIKGRKIQYIKLIPKNPDAEIKNILLGIDPQTKHIYNLIQTEEDGTKTTITITSFKTDQPIPEALFVFDEERYPGFYINRLN
ncbi:MAG TPA: outer membrane lipoprotein carrier protein LolA [Salinimicrobium sp.]|nr:outer membrane lipoprotein carrier protein LolA [Salinimicrobium sp.]